MHPEWIQNEEMMRKKMEYIHQNPVKRGYVDRPEHWRHSSGRNYAGMDGFGGGMQAVVVYGVPGRGAFLPRVCSHGRPWEGS